MLNKGDHASDIELKDGNGKKLMLSEIAGGKKLLMFFFPKDFSLICTKQVCMIKDGFSCFKKPDLKVIGVSSDDAQEHKKFKEKYGLPFELFTDQGFLGLKTLGFSKSFGLLPKRVTILLDENLLCLMSYSSQLDIAGHFDLAKRSI